MRHVSEPEKKPEHASNNASRPNSQLMGMSSVMGPDPGASCSLQDQFQHHLAADIGEQQHREAGESPVHGSAPAPAPDVVPDQEAAEDQPGQDAEHGLVVELQRLAEELLREEDAAHDGKREEHEGG